MALANLALLEIDRAILTICKDLELTYSRFVDDLVFSGARVREVIQPAIELLRDAGFAVGRGKVEIFSRGKRQEVTGYLVNGQGRLVKGRPYRDSIREALFDLRATPLESAAFETLASQIRGRIGHFGSVNPDAALNFKKQLAEVTDERMKPAQRRRRRRKGGPKGQALTRWRNSLRQTAPN